MFSVEELVIQHRTQKVTVVNIKKRMTPTGRTDGMGILYMGYESVFCNKPPPWMRNKKKNLDDSIDDDTPNNQESELQSNKTLIPNMGFSDELQTVLDTGAIKLIRTTSANSASDLREQVSVPMWVFTNTGPNVYFPQIEGKEIDGDDNESPIDGTECLAPVPINKSHNAPVDLNTCRQFSIVKYEDISEPKKSMVMIQTPEHKSIHDVETGLYIKALEDGSGDCKIKQLESEIDCDEMQSYNSHRTSQSDNTFHTNSIANSSQNSSILKSSIDPDLVVRPKVPRANKVKLHLESPESPTNPTITSPTIVKYLNCDNPHLLAHDIKENAHDIKENSTLNGEQWDEMEEFSEFATRCRPSAHALSQGDNAVSNPALSLKETKLKSKLADSGLYRPSNDVSNQLSLSHDVDSGIWDMIQGKESAHSSQSSSRGSTPVIVARPDADSSKQMLPLVSDIQELNINDMILSNPLQSTGDKPSIAYRAFKVDSNTNEVVLSKATVATYVPLLEDHSIPQLLGSEVGSGAITTIDEQSELALNGHRISEISDSDTDEYHLALDAQMRLKGLSESEGEVFESAVENIESSDALTDSTPIADVDNDWCILSNDDASMDTGESKNSVNNLEPNKCSENKTAVHDIEKNGHIPAMSDNSMVNECTQTSPMSPGGRLEVAPKCTEPVRKLSTHRQRSYAQAIVHNDVTSPESESGWFTAQENVSDAQKKSKPKFRKKSREEGQKGHKSGNGAINGRGVAYTSTSEMPSSTSDDVTSSTDTSPNSPAGQPIQSTVAIQHTHASSMTSVDAHAQTTVPAITDIKVEYDYTARRGSGTLVSNIQNAMDINYEHEYTNERSPKIMQGIPKNGQTTHFKSAENVSTQRAKSRRGLNNVTSISRDLSDIECHPAERPISSKGKSVRSKHANTFVKSAGKDDKYDDVTHANGDVIGKTEDVFDDDSDVTPSADDEERQLLSCGSDDFRQRDVTVNPFEAPISPVISRRKPTTLQDTSRTKATEGRAVARNGVVSKTSPPSSPQVTGLGLNQLQAARVVTRNPARPTSVSSRQGVGLNQFQTSSPTTKRKAKFRVSLLSPSGSASSEEHSPAHRGSSRGSESPYLVASYSDGSDWGDESLLWDAEGDSDEASYAHEADLDVCDFEMFPDWMSELPERLHDVSLTSLAIPGSHISFAIERDMKTDMDIAKSNYEMAEFLRKLPNLSIFNNFRSLIKQIWKAWMPKQMLSVTQQLYAGVRYLDIRVTKYRSALYAEHGLYSKQLIKYLKEVKCFLDSHPKEVVILHFEALNQIDTKDKRRLVTSLFQIFGARMAKVTPEASKLTLKSLWRRKKQVLIVFPTADTEALHNHIFVGLIWPDTSLTTQSPKAQTQDELRNFLDSTYYNVLAMRTKRDTFQITRAVLSPDMSMLFGEYEFQSMRQLTVAETHSCVSKWLEHKTNVNIVAFDFVGANHLIEKVIRLNDSKFIVQTTV